MIDNRGTVSMRVEGARLNHLQGFTGGFIEQHEVGGWNLTVGPATWHVYELDTVEIDLFTGELSVVPYERPERPLPPRSEDLQEFFQGRTLGVTSSGEWSWRGPGYDVGWVPVTEEELSRLRDLLRTPGISASGGEQS